jgi:hypothetical protein
MDNSIYDEDILVWSEQQASVIWRKSALWK